MAHCLLLWIIISFQKPSKKAGVFWEKNVTKKHLLITKQQKDKESE